MRRLRPARQPADDGSRREEPAARRALDELKDGEDIFVGSKRALLRSARRRSTSLAKLYYANPDATLVAGATDVGLWITKQLRDLPKVIWLGRVEGLDEIEDRRDAVELRRDGDACRARCRISRRSIRDLGELMRRFAGTQVRMAGTVGGNIANGSPIGDLPPALIALGATLALQRGDRAAHAAAGELLHRLRQAGSPAGRVRARGARAEARRRRALPLLQDLQALRRATFPP